MTTTRQRRTSEQWQAIVDTYHNAGLTAPAFCRQEGISYASFMKWKNRFSKDLVTDSDKPTFIELPQTPVPQSRWAIELDLAPGVQLRIAR